eukprot:6196718-Pleurochrysis_carterae.AAC.1
MTGTGDGRDIELHIMIVVGEDLIHMHYKNFPLDKCFDYTLNGDVAIESPVFAKFGDSESWTSGSWIGGEEPLQQFEGWTFSSGSDGVFSSSTNGFYCEGSSIYCGANISSNISGWSSVVVYARRCIGRDDCVLGDNVNRLGYLASVETGTPTPLTVYPGTLYSNFPLEVERLLPCWGMITLGGGGDNQSLKLTRKTLIFLLWYHGWITPFNGGSFGDESLWTRLNDTPQQYFSNRSDRLLTIYKKVVPPGDYTIDTYL